MEFLTHELEIFLKRNNIWKTIVKLNNYDFNDTYKKEVTNFILSAKNKQKQLIKSIEGIDDLKIVLSAFNAYKKRKFLKL